MTESGGKDFNDEQLGGSDRQTHGGLLLGRLPLCLPVWQTQNRQTPSQETGRIIG
jgi:hypothetical protein